MSTGADLLDRRLAVRVSLHGFPGRMTVPASWDTGILSLREHMVYFVRRGRIRINDQVLGPGACALIPPGRPFQAGALGGPAAIMRCRLDISRLRRPVPALEQVTIRPRAWELEPVVAMLIDEVDASAAAADRARCCALLLVTGLARVATATAGLDARQRHALADLVERHRAHGLTPRDLAAHLDLTLDYFTRQFRLAFAVAPRRWLVHERIRAACALLAEGGTSLEAVAASLGYADLKLFGRQFRQVMGMPPGRWRSRLTGSRP